jgi:hypothetical protein
MLFIFQISMFSLSSISRDYILCKHPVRFSSIGSRGLNRQFLIPLILLFRFTLYIWRPSLYYCYSYWFHPVDLSAFPFRCSMIVTR